MVMRARELSPSATTALRSERCAPQLFSRVCEQSFPRAHLSACAKNAARSRVAAEKLTTRTLLALSVGLGLRRGIVNLSPARPDSPDEKECEEPEYPPAASRCMLVHAAPWFRSEHHMQFPTRTFVLLVFLGVILPGGHAQSQTVVGRLLDGEAMQPIPWGFIQLLDSASQPVSFTFSDEDGDFILSAPGAGRYLILAEAYSYHTVQDGPVELRAADTIGVQFFIPPDPEQLDPLVVEAKRLDLRLRTSGFYRRQRRGMGEFITREDIDDIRPHDMSGLLV